MNVPLINVSLILVAMGLCVSLGACSEPITETRNIPAGISTREQVFHQTKWFDCAAAVWRLERSFVDRLRQSGPGSLPSRDGTTWVSTPVPDDMSKQGANLVATWDCLSGTPYDDLFEAAAHRAGSYYLYTPGGGTDILLPAQGLLLIGGFE